VSEKRAHDAFETVEFVVELEGDRVHCWITHHALATHFGATPGTALATLLRHRERIDAVARRAARNTPKGERVLVRSIDFDDCRSRKPGIASRTSTRP
jgi:hypothetical protein